MKIKKLWLLITAIALAGGYLILDEAVGLKMPSFVEIAVTVVTLLLTALFAVFNRERLARRSDGPSPLSDKKK